MKLLLSSFERRQELVLAFILLLISTLVFVLFLQEQLIYYLIGLVILVVLVWAQFNIRRWIYLIFLGLPFSPTVNISSPKIPASLEMSDFLVWAALVIFILNQVVSSRHRGKTDYYLLIPLLIYLAACAFSSLIGYYWHHQIRLILNAFGHLFKWSSYVFLYFIILRVFNQEKDYKNLLRVIMISFGLGSIIGVYRYLTHSPGSESLYRAPGLMEGINGYAVFLAIILIFFFNLAIQKKSREILPFWLFMTLWSLMVLAVIVTFSRSGWLVLWGGLFFLSLIRKHRYLSVLLLFGAIFNFYLLRGPVERRIKATLQPEDETELPIDLGGRDLIWKTAIQRIRVTNLLGVGYGNFPQTLMGTTAHNQYLAVLGESGLLGLFAFLFLLYRLFRAQLFLARHHPHPFYRECAIGIFTGLIATILISVSGEFFYSSPGMAIMLAFYAPARKFYSQKYLNAQVNQQPIIPNFLKYKYG